jgi:hypothetical protein
VPTGSLKYPINKLKVSIVCQFVFFPNFFWKNPLRFNAEQAIQLFPGDFTGSLSGRLSLASCWSGTSIPRQNCGELYFRGLTDFCSLEFASCSGAWCSMEWIKDTSSNEKPSAYNFTVNTMLPEARRLSIDTSNQHLSTSFTYVPPRAVVSPRYLAILVVNIVKRSIFLDP